MKRNTKPYRPKMQTDIFKNDDTDTASSEFGFNVAKNLIEKYAADSFANFKIDYARKAKRRDNGKFRMIALKFYDLFTTYKIYHENTGEWELVFHLASQYRGIIKEDPHLAAECQNLLNHMRTKIQMKILNIEGI